MQTITLNLSLPVPRSPTLLLTCALTSTAESGTHSILYDPNQPGRETVEDSYSFAEATAVRLGGARRDNTSCQLNVKSLYGRMHRRICGCLMRTVLERFQPLNNHTHPLPG